MATTPNGLELANLGTFLDDPSADTINSFADKTNENMELIDTTISLATNLNNDMTTLRNRGLITGIIYGGSF